MRVGDQVILKQAPDFVRTLPPEDQAAIEAGVGKWWTFVELREDGLVEIDFDCPLDGLIHTLFVEPDMIEPAA